MGMDEDNDDGLGGRSRDRREVTEANRWARPLCALTEAELRAAPLPDPIREAVELGRAIRSYRARDRQYQRIDKLVRLLEPRALARLDAFLADPVEAPDPGEVAADALLAGGDEALQAWVEAHPGADRQRLRSLLRQARRDGGARAALVAALNGYFL
jgi:ribosome-associated protein